jgi:hypothetical protein
MPIARKPIATLILRRGKPMIRRVISLAGLGIVFAFLLLVNEPDAMMMSNGLWCNTPIEKQAGHAIQGAPDCEFFRAEGGVGVLTLRASHQHSGIRHALAIAERNAK